MNYNDINFFKEWFCNYSKSFYSDDSDSNYAINIKVEHTYRVCQNIILLGKSLNLSDTEIILAETIALFHDLGRFKQFAIYKTFKDSISENHATIALKELSINRVLKICSSYEKNIVATAIANHNVGKIRDIKDQKKLFFIKLIRDTDKLDILKVMTDYYNGCRSQINEFIVLNFPDHPFCSKLVLDSFFKKEFVKFEDLKTLNDFKLLQISWVFDLNFPVSFQILKQHNYIEKIEATLPKTQEVVSAVKEAYVYIKNKSI